MLLPLLIVHALVTGPSLPVASVPARAVDRGNYAVVPVTLRNDTSTTWRHIQLTLTTVPGLEPVADYTNCTIDRTATTATCVIDQMLAPGAAVTLPATTNPLMVKVQEDAGGPYTYAVKVTAAATTSAAPTGPGPRLSLVPATGSASYSAAANFGITVGESATELDATGAVITKDTTTVRVGVTNAGAKATVPGTSTTARVTMPPGVEVTAAPKECRSGDDGYICTTTQRLRPSQSALFDFTVQPAGTGHGSGRVTLSTGDTAEIAWMQPAGQSRSLPVAGAATAAALLLTAFAFARRRPARRRTR